MPGRCHLRFRLSGRIPQVDFGLPGRQCIRRDNSNQKHCSSHEFTSARVSRRSTERWNMFPPFPDQSQLETETVKCQKKSVNQESPGASIKHAIPAQASRHASARRHRSNRSNSASTFFGARKDEHLDKGRIEWRQRGRIRTENGTLRPILG